MNLLSFTSHQLRRAADLVERIDKLKAELTREFGSHFAATEETKKKRGMSEAGRLAIIAGQKARWAKVKVKAKSSIKKAGRRAMSAAARAKIAAAAKARWAKAKAAGKKSL